MQGLFVTLQISAISLVFAFAVGLVTALFQLSDSVIARAGFEDTMESECRKRSVATRAAAAAPSPAHARVQLTAALLEPIRSFQVQSPVTQTAGLCGAKNAKIPVRMNLMLQLN